MKGKIQKSAMYSNIKKNTILNMIKTFTAIIFPLITFPYISRVLRLENVGKFNFCNSIVRYFSLAATLGVTSYAVRECSQVKDNKKALEKIASEIISLNFCTMLVSYFILILSLLFVPRLTEYRALIGVLSITIFFTVIGADWLNTTMEDFKYITLRTVSFQVLSLILMFLFVKKESDYIKYAVIFVISSSGGNICNVFYRRKYGNIVLTYKINWKKHLPPIMMLFAMIVSQTILQSMDVVMLGFMKGDNEVGLYSTAMNLITIVSQVITSICWVLMPQLSQQFAVKNYEKANSVLQRAIAFSITLTLPSVAGLIILAKEIILVVAGVEYQDAANCLRILSISMALNVASSILGNMILLPAKREKQFAIACIAGMGSNIVANIVLIPYFAINGASVATVISAIVILIGTMYKPDKNIKILNFRGIIKAPIIGTLIIIAIGLVLHDVPIGVLSKVVVTITLSIVSYGGVLILTKNEFAMEFIRPFVKKYFNV